MSHLLTDVEGNGHSSAVEVDEKGVRLPKQAARYLIISNWNVSNDPSLALIANPGNLGPTELEHEVYWGFNGVYAHQLFPGQTTELIPVNDLSQITLRTRPGLKSTVWFSWIN